MKRTIEDLVLAIQLSNIIYVKYTLEEDLSLADMRLKDGRTALHAALATGNNNCDHASIIAELLSKMSKESIEAIDNKGNNILHHLPSYALSSKDDFQIGKMILKRSHELFDKINLSGKTALHIAAEKNNSILTECLLSNMSKEAIAFKDTDGRTALHIAAKARHPEIVSKFLYQPHEFFTITDKLGKTALELVRTSLPMLSDTEKTLEMLHYKTSSLEKIIHLCIPKDANNISQEAKENMTKIKHAIALHCKSLLLNLPGDIAKIVYEYVVDPVIIGPNLIFELQDGLIAHEAEIEADTNVLGN